MNTNKQANSNKFSKIARPCLVLLALSSFAIAGHADAQETSGKTQNSAPQGEKNKPQLSLKAIRKFAETFHLVQKNYVEAIDDETLLIHAVRGILSGLDPHSAYLDKQRAFALKESTSGAFGGIGIEYAMDKGFVRVIAPLDNTPAQRAGIKTNDLIISIEKKPVRGMQTTEITERTRGPIGSTVNLTVLRDGNTLNFSLQRALIKVTAVSEKIIEAGYGYVRIAQFQEGVSQETREAILKLKQKTQLNGLILDLRNNPGGLLVEALGVANIFMNRGLISYTQGRDNKIQNRYFAQAGDLSEQIPLVMLINGGSASASEIVAGALQDHRRAIVLGTASFGKGSVQNVLNLPDGDAIKLTTARYFTPRKRVIQGRGIKPDIHVPEASIDMKEEPRFKERDLPNSLSDSETQPVESDRQLESRLKNEKLFQQDNQLFSALNQLKSMRLMKIRESRKTRKTNPKKTR